MQFDSLCFLASFAVFVLLYYLAAWDTVRKFMLFGLNVFFYLSFGAKFCLFLGALTLATFGFGKFIFAFKEDPRRRVVLFFCLFFSLLPLVFYKYFNFICESAASAAGFLGIAMNKYTLRLMVPVGISFYTFKIISYLADIYKGKIEPGSLLDYFLYVWFFAQIVCGPIERYENFAQNLRRKIRFDSANIECGTKLIILGFFKKYAVADNLAGYVNAVFSASDTANGISLALAGVFFSIQLYCDFSGYTDIALGLSKMLGFDFSQNFRRPYFSSGVKEFWNRWHITLSAWLRDYVYIPLGGGRCSAFRKNLNVIITFLVSGIWHGANWTFVFWGLMHGVFIVIQNLARINFWMDSKIFAFFKVAATFIAVASAWIFFRAQTISQAFSFIADIFRKFSLSQRALVEAILPFSNDNTSIAYFLTAVFLILVLFAYEFFEENRGKFGCLGGSKLLAQIFYSFLLLCVLMFGNFNSTAFIYAQF